MALYKSCNQKIKDDINNILFLNTDKNSNSLVITLDDLDNGTCTSFMRKGFSGQFVVIQRDAYVATQQVQNWDDQFSNVRFDVHVNDITKQFSILSPLWLRNRVPRLWNFDYVSTFFTEIPYVLATMFQDPSVSFARDAIGTNIAFTFQGIANGRILANMTNIDPEKVALWKSMKKWKKTEIFQYYNNLINKIVDENKPKCVEFAPVLLKE